MPLERIPVFVRAGGLVPTLPPADTTPAGPLRSLVLTAYRGTGWLRLYDDAGDGLAFERGRSSRTRVKQRRIGRSTLITIGRARGRLAPAMRDYELRLVGIARPSAVTVGGRETREWTYDAGTRTATIDTGELRTDRAATIVAR